MKDVIGYVRVSTEGQGENGGSLANQAQTIREYADSKGYNLISIFSEVASAKRKHITSGRPVLADALTMAVEQDVRLIITDGSRLTRSVDALTRLPSEINAQLIILNASSICDPVALTSLTAQNERLRQRISETTKAGLAKAKARGTKLGNPTNLDEARALGTKASKDKADERAAALGSTVIDWHKKEGLSYRAIAKRLEAKNYPTASGGVWTASTVSGVFKRLRDNPQFSHLLLEPKTEDHTNHSDNWGRW